MKISNEAKVGALTLIAIIILVLGYNFLRGKKVFNRDQTFYAIYDDVKGLLVANPIRMNGLQVGIVESITPRKDYKVTVAFSVNDDVRVPDGSLASIVSDGLLGEMAMLLDLPKDSLGKYAFNGRFHEDGDTLNGKVSGGMMDMAMEQIGPIKDRAEKVIITLDSTLAATNKIMRSQQLAQTLNNVESLTKKLQTTADNANSITGDVKNFTANDMKQLNQILGDAKSLMAELRTSATKLNPILDDAKGITANVRSLELKKTTDNLNATLSDLQTTVKTANGLIADLQKGEGTMGKLLTDDKLYTDLNKTIKDLDVLLNNFDNTPGKYLGTILYPKRTEKRYQKMEEKEGKE